MPLHVPTPDISKLNNNFLLEEIIDHVGELRGDFPKVNIDELIDQLTRVRSKKFDPEEQLRGFLKTFEKTTAYRDGYSKLDDRTKSRLDAFIKGRSAAEVVGQEDVSLQPSPAAKDHFRLLDHSLQPSPGEKPHFRLLDALRKLRVHKFDIKSLKKDLKAADVPLIYENEAQTELMEVRTVKSLDDFACLSSKY